MGKTFDEIVSGKSAETEPIAVKEPIENSDTTTTAQKETKEESVIVSEQKPVEEPLLVDAPVDDPDYALYYYEPTPKNFSAASLWFAFAYALFTWPIMVLFHFVAETAATFNIKFGDKADLYLLVALSVIGLISFVCAIVGFFTFKKFKHSYVPGIISLLIVGVTAAGCWLLFV